MLHNKQSYSRMLTEPDIIECRKNHRGIIITPFNKNKAKGIGYNLSPSDLFYSLKKCSPLKIRYNEEGSFVYIKPQDTVLILSYEHIQSEDNITGTFHSRVRSSADGLGSVSTTLDPGWKGMLLISISNPTSRKIKIPITTKKDGRIERCNLITMVVFQNYSMINENENVSFHVDNPPMRADIWSELTSKPHNLFHEKNYKKFQSFIQKLINFKYDENDITLKYKVILEYILEIEIALCANKSVKSAKIPLIKLSQCIPEDDKELKNKYLALNEHIKKTKNLFTTKNESKTKQLIELFRNECKYLMLCEEVKQIHRFINQNITKWWKHGKIYSLIYKYLLPNLIAIIATIFLLLILFFGLTFNFDDNSSLLKIIIAFIPVLASFCINAIKEKCDK